MARSDKEQGFGARLAEVRKAAGYTQVQLAEALGMSQRMIAYYESIESAPLARILRLLSEKLGVSTDEVLGIAPIRPVSRHSHATRAKSKKTGRRKK